MPFRRSPKLSYSPTGRSIHLSESGRRSQIILLLAVPFFTVMLAFFNVVLALVFSRSCSRCSGALQGAAENRGKGRPHPGCDFDMMKSRADLSRSASADQSALAGEMPGSELAASAVRTPRPRAVRDRRPVRVWYPASTRRNPACARTGRGDRFPSHAA